MKITEVPYYEIRLYIGCREGYHGEIFGKRQLMKSIREFKNTKEDSVSVRITKCTYQLGDWDEDGWEIASIDYPRFPKGCDFLRTWFTELAEYLIKNMNQNRITVCDPTFSRTFEKEDAEQI